MTGCVVKEIFPFNCNGVPVVVDLSGPASARGAPGDRGPSFTPVVCITSKFVMLIEDKWLNSPAAQRLSGTAEMEKKLPLSATRAPYFFKPLSTAFSGVVQLSGIKKLCLRRTRWPIAGTFVTDAAVVEAKCVAG